MEFYDVGSSDLRELWDSYLVESSLGQDVLMGGKEEDWCPLGNSRELGRQTSFGVVLRDRLMTDAALGGPKPIKAEHSYSMLACSPPPVQQQQQQQQQRRQERAPVAQQQLQRDSRIDVTDMEEECFPAISMNTASGRDSSSSTPEPCMLIKGEPLSPCSDDAALLDESAACISPHSIHLHELAEQQSSDSEEEEEDVPQEMVEAEPASSQELPPTPPSSASSDSEGTVSASCSPERRDSLHARAFLQPRLYVTTAAPASATRQPIHTPLISCQPKGSTGMLVLTDEEKRTLIAEGYPVPTKLPLTKQEEKSLKKVRRKIKNKISAQESRRKKKEYMDGLERRVSLLTNENTSYREKVSTLESTNRQLVKELQRLQALIQRTSS